MFDLSGLQLQIDENKAFKAVLKTLPKEEAEILRSDRRKRLKEKENHRRNLEIAATLRPRNFWGQ